MTHYLGSKQRHAANIIAITCANRKKGQVYCEPFCGGGNVIVKVPQKDGRRVANDLNWRIVALLDAAGNKGWQPPEAVTKEEFFAVKENPDAFPPEYVAFVRTGMTFGSDWEGGFNNMEQACDVARRAVLKDAPGLKGIEFHSMSYVDFAQHIPPESIVYCDPPYRGTTGYGGAKTNIEIGESLAKNSWNANTFWRWADGLVDQGYQVFVSEYKGPPPNIYRESAALKSERERAATRFQWLQTDSKSSRADRDEAAIAIKDVERRIQEDRVRTAARWKLAWEKEVTSDFNHTVEREEQNRKEFERLFHREP